MPTPPEPASASPPSPPSPVFSLSPTARPLSDTVVVAPLSLARVARRARAELFRAARELRRTLVVVEFDVPKRDPHTPASSRANATATFDQFERGLRVLGGAEEGGAAEGEGDVVSWMLHRKLCDGAEQDEQPLAAWRAELEDVGFTVRVIAEPRLCEGCWAPIFALRAW